MKYVLLLILSTSVFANETINDLLGTTPVNQIHFINVSEKARPITGLIDSHILGNDHYLESKFMAGIVDKLRDDDTDSKLYKKYRDEYKVRGIYAKVKAQKDIDDILKAKKLAKEFYFDYLEDLNTQNTLFPFLNGKDEFEEMFRAYTKPSDEDIELAMNSNEDAYRMANAKLSYFGSVPSHGVNALKLNRKNLSFHPIDLGGKAIIVVHHKIQSLCNDGLNFFDCYTSQTVDLDKLGFVAIIYGDDKIDTQGIFNKFKNKKKVNIKNILSEDLRYFSRKDIFLNIESPMIPVRTSAIPSNLLNQSTIYNDVNDTIAKDYQFRNEDIKDIIYKATEENYISANYKFKKEIKLKPNEVIYLVLPQGFSEQHISSIILGHRQNPRDQRGSMSFNPRTGVKTYDAYPAYASVQVHSVKHNYANSWRGWGGPVSGDKRSKFAEIKKSPEYDNLYEWPKKGHVSIQNETKEKSLLYGDMIKIEALGSDPIYVAEVQVKLVAPLNDNYVERSFTHNRTSLGDPLTMSGRTYGGGGRQYNGKFPGAIRLSPKEKNAITFSNGEILTRVNRKRQLIIPAKGRNVRSIDIAIGDTKPDMKPNQNGGIGSLGASQITIMVQTQSNQYITLVERENVSPAGVITTHNTVNNIKNIIIQVHRDTSYLMGYRYGYDD